MGNKIFINYRRKTNRGQAQLFYKALTGKFGKSRVFLDVNGIEPGERWLDTLAKQVEASSIMVSLIDKDWLDAKDDQGNRSLDNPHDFVRYEISRALTHNIPVLPILLNDATMPKIGQLPPDLQALTFIQGLQVRIDYFDNDVEEVFRRVKQLSRYQGGMPYWLVAILMAVTAGSAATATHYWWPRVVVSDERIVKELEGKINAKADEVVRLIRDKSALDKKAEQLQFEVDELNSRLKTAIGEKQRTANALANLKKSAGLKQSELQQHLQSANNQISTLKKRLETTQSSLKTARAEVKKLEQKIVKLGSDNKTQSDDNQPIASDKSFKDCKVCPSMVIIPGGKFIMGSAKGEKGRGSDEGPRREVSIKSFAVGRFEVTLGQYKQFVKETSHKPGNKCWAWENSKWVEKENRNYLSPGFSQTDTHPVTCVNWNDATAYVKWLSRKTGKPYRLLTEAEWEYAATAGTDTAFWWGNSISTYRANYNGNYTYGDGVKGVYRQKTVPVDSFKANSFGIYNVHGNVWEWVEDCWHKNYTNTPTDGSVWLEANTGNCSQRVMRGGSWFNFPLNLRARNRNWFNRDFRGYNVGFRVAMALTSI